MATTTRTPVLMCWSGGKDSCLALWEMQRNPGLQVQVLLTTVTRDYGRISMHGVRCELLQRQAASLGLPLQLMQISKGAGNDEYEAEFGRAWPSTVPSAPATSPSATCSWRTSAPIGKGCWRPTA